MPKYDNIPDTWNNIKQWLIEGYKVALSVNQGFLNINLSLAHELFDDTGDNLRQ